jgi:hypothetical protein
MNIIALISELKWYHDVATTCATDLTPTPQATKERTKGREREREREREQSDAKGKRLRLRQRLCASWFNLCRKSSTL